MTISDFYTNQIICASIGKARIRRSFSALRELLPPAIDTKTFGQFPWFYKPVNTYYAAWILYTMSNSGSYTHEDIAASIERGLGLESKEGKFINWLSRLLESDMRTSCIDHLNIYIGSDCRVVVYFKDGNCLYFRGKGHSNGITKCVEISEQFLTQLAIEINN